MHDHSQFIAQNRLNCAIFRVVLRLPDSCRRLSDWLQSVAQIYKIVQCAACLVPELQKKCVFSAKYLLKVCIV